MASLHRSIRKVVRVGTRAVRTGMRIVAGGSNGKVIPQSGVIPYRWCRGRLRVLLITSRRSGDWIVPKGLVEPGMTEHDSAAKEAAEEAGVTGRVGTEPVGSFTYEKWGGVCAVSIFDMEIAQERSDWPEKAERTRKWFDVDDAAASVKYAGLGRIIAGLPRRLAVGESREAAGRPDSP